VGQKQKRGSQTGKVGVATQQPTNKAQGDDSESDERGRDVERGSRSVTGCNARQKGELAKIFSRIVSLASNNA